MYLIQTRSQGFLPFLYKDLYKKGKKPWERGWYLIHKFLSNQNKQYKTEKKEENKLKLVYNLVH